MIIYYLPFSNSEMGDTLVVSTNKISFCVHHKSLFLFIS